HLTLRQAEDLRSELAPEAAPAPGAEDVPLIEPGDEADRTEVEPPPPAAPPSDAAVPEKHRPRTHTLLAFEGTGERRPSDVQTRPGLPSGIGAPGALSAGTIPPASKDTRADLSKTVVGGESAPASPSADVKRIGPYRVLEEIGRGGMGVVYKAFDPSLKRIVALKVLIGGEHASEGAIARFRREAEAVAKVGSHPGIVPIYDMGNEGNLHYFAMAFVQGKSLSRLIDLGEINPRRAMTIAGQVARALHFAHQHGVLHRDIKPDNILVNEDGVPALTDFGLAKDVAEESHLTVSGTAMGTPQYMPPEQADGRLEDVDVRSDVYSLGATLYEMLAHAPPFAGSSYQNTLYKVLKEEVVPPRKRNPAVPREAETICLKAIEKDRDRRYATAGDLADDVQRFLDGEPIQARPASLLYRVSKRVKRNLPLYATGAAAAVLLLSSLSFFLLVKPAMDLRREIEEDRRLLREATERRLEPEQKARALLGKAEAFAAQERFGDCTTACDELIRTYTPLLGTRFEEIPAVRHPALLAEAQNAILRAPYSFPVARAHALKARALHKAGAEGDSLDAWLLAYARAKVSEDPAEAAVRGTALLQIGQRLLGLQDLNRAAETFRKFLRDYPGDPEADRGRLGLGDAFWRTGRFALATAALAPLESSRALDAGERGTALWILGMARRFGRELSLPRPPGAVLAGDLEGDGRPEWFAYSAAEGLAAWRLEGRALAPLFRIPPKELFGEALAGKPPAHGAEIVNLHGPGKVALLLTGGEEGGTGIWLVPVSPEGKAGEAIRGLVPGGSLHVDAGDMDGDGTAEIGVSRYNPGEILQVLRIEGRALVEAARFQNRSYREFQAMSDADGDGRAEYFVEYRQFGDFRPLVVECEGPGKPYEIREFSPYRFIGTFLPAAPEPGRPAALWAQVAGANGDDLRIMRGITEPRFILESGFFRVERGSPDPPLDYTRGFPTWKPVLGHGQRLPKDRLLLMHARLPENRNGVAFRAEDPERPWGFWVAPEGRQAGRVLAGDFDGDGEAEGAVLLDGEIRILGRGDAAPATEADVLGRDPESRTLEGLENPYLATALEMASMEWKEQALRLFQQAREHAANAFEARRAMLGEADCLIKLGRSGEAAGIYRRMVDSSSLGITEELFTLVALFKREGRWKEILDLLRAAQAGVTLPEETRRWVNETAAKTEPLTRIEHPLPCLPAPAFDPSYLCRHPLKSPGSRGGGDFEFLADGMRRSAFGRMVQWDGGPLRLEARILFRRQDWTCHLRFGLFRVGRVGETTWSSPALTVLVQTGQCTDLPAIFVNADAWGLGGTGALLREYPQRFPAELAFELEYAPSMGRISLKIRDETHGQSWSMTAGLQGSLPPGKYVLGLAGSEETAWSEFQGRFAVKRLEAFTASKENKPEAWEPSPGAFRVLRAGAALALGDPKSALELAAATAPDEADPAATVGIPFWERTELDPTPAAAARVVEAFARLRTGDAGGFGKALSDALGMDAGRVLWYLSRSSPGFPPEEEAVVGKALREALSAERGRLAVQAVADFRENPRRRSRDFQGLPDPAWPSLEAALRRAGAAPEPEAFPQTLFAVLSRLCRGALVEAVFRGTPLGAQARLQRLLQDASAWEHTGAHTEARETYDLLVAEFPEHPTALNAAAWHRVARKNPKPEDAREAIGLARRAVALARAAQPPNPADLACNLDTLARALFVAGELDEALRAQEEAVAKLDDAMDPDLIRELRGNLEAYRKARKAKDEGRK
ncbi:MAG: protein kinase, partial [Planctomycetes bacterium]|nr:protein kinase [Planctomycetota bacterium]